MKKRQVVILCIIAISICSMFGGCSNSLSEGSVELLREEYPYNDSMPILASRRTAELEECVDMSSAYIVGTIIESLEPVVVDLSSSMNEGQTAIQNKNGGITDSVTYYPFSIRVDEIIYNMQNEISFSRGDTIEIAITDIEMECMPNMSNGQSYAMGLIEMKISRFDYGIIKEGMFYKTDKEYVLSVVSKQSADKYSGYTLKEFSEEIEKMKE